MLLLVVVEGSGREVEDKLLGLFMLCGSRLLERAVEGRMSFFCFEAGRISSRSMGTPRETRKRRRMRERTQFGGWRGGGAASCVQREAARGVGKMGEGVVWAVGRGGGAGWGCVVVGKRVLLGVAALVIFVGGSWGVGVTYLR